MSLILGAVKVGGASRMCDTAHWGNWADCLEMVRNRHPHIWPAALQVNFKCARVGRPIERQWSGLSIYAKGLDSPPRESRLAHPFIIR